MTEEKKWPEYKKPIGLINLLRFLAKPRSCQEIMRHLCISDRGVYRYSDTLEEAGIALFPQKRERITRCLFEEGMKVKITATFANGEKKEVPLDQCVFAFLASFFEEKPEETDLIDEEK